jgi:hypothetical protein
MIASLKGIVVCIAHLSQPNELGWTPGPHLFEIYILPFHIEQYQPSMGAQSHAGKTDGQVQ